MNGNTLSTRPFAFALASLVCLGITATSLQAQTFAGRAVLNAQPGSLRASIYPVINSSMIRVDFAHAGSGAVRIQIWDEQGHVWHEQFEYIRQYKGHFDLAGLPAGAYRVSLQTNDARYTQQIQIAPPVTAQVSLINDQPASEPVAQRLVVNQ